MDFFFITLLFIAGAAIAASLLMSAIGGRHYRQMATMMRLMGIFAIGAAMAFWFLLGDGQMLPGEIPSWIDDEPPVQEQPPAVDCEKTGSYAYIEYLSRSSDCHGLEQRGNEWVTWCSCA